MAAVVVGNVIATLLQTSKLRIPDLGSTATTMELGKAIEEAV